MGLISSTQQLLPLLCIAKPGSPSLSPSHRTSVERNRNGKLYGGLRSSRHNQSYESYSKAWWRGETNPRLFSATATVNKWLLHLWVKAKVFANDDVVALVTKGCYMANLKVDLKSVYRPVPNIQHRQRVTGLKWKFGKQTIFFKDTKLCFGLQLASGIFHLWPKQWNACLIDENL